MSFLSKLLERAGLQRAGTKSAGESVNSFILRADGEGGISPAQAMNEFKGWTYACVRAIAEDIANMEIKVMKTGSDDMDEQIYEHDIIDLLDGVNPHTTSFELKYITAAHLELTGNAYWFLDGVTDENSKPKAIYVMNPKDVKVMKSATFPQEVIGYKHTFANHESLFKPFQVLHFKSPNPTNPFDGQGTVESIASWIDSDNHASDFNRAFYKNSARPDAILESELASSPENMEYLKKSFENVYRGAHNAHKTLVLPPKTTFKPTGFTQKDMDFVQSTRDARDKILAGFRVPRTVLGLTDDVNRANAEATNYVFALRTIKPKMKLIVTYLNEFLVPRFGDDIYLDFKSPVPEDRTTDIAEMSAATAGKPVLTQNEARERYFGYEDVEGGDTIESPTGPMTFGMKKRIKSSSKRPAKTRFAKNHSTRKDVAKTLAESVATILKDLPADSLKDVQEDEAIWKSRTERVDPKEKEAAKAVQKFNDDQIKRVLKNLDNATKSAKAVDGDDLFDMEGEVKILIDLMTPIMREVAKTEGNEALRLIGLDALDTLPKPTELALANAMELMARKYNESTVDLLKAKLDEGIAEGFDRRALEKSVEEVYEFSNEVRASMVARSESYRIANDSARLAWKDSGVVKSIRWYTAEDEAVCEYCGPMNGKTVGIDEGYFKEGDSIEGADGGTLDISYSDVENPPLHVNCRCLIRPEEVRINNGVDAELDNLIDEITNA